MTDQEKQKVRSSFDKMVMPYRFGPRRTGRTYTLSCAQKIYEEDYLRVIVSPPFRRMQDKAQVFPLESSDFVRTRLTHSLEVSFFGYALGRKVEDALYKEELISEDVYSSHVIPSILKVSGLIHDIGNTPFGHFGEQSFQEFYKKVNNGDVNKDIQQAFQSLSEKEREDLLHFDGNVQGLRVVKKLASANHTLSLDLTKSVIATMIKYPYDSKTGNNKKTGNHCQEKFGYFDAEKSTYLGIINTLKLQDHQRHPLTYLLEAADDIAYSVSDIEDGFSLKTMSLNTIQEVFKEYRNTALLSSLESYEKDRQDVYVQQLRLRVQDKMIEDCAKYYVSVFDKIVMNTYNHEPILESSSSADLRKATKKLAINNFEDKRVIKHEILGGEIITALLTMFTKAIFDRDLIKADNTFNTKCKAYKLYSLISSGFKNVQCRTTKDIIPPTPYGKFLLVNDFISGMTDSYALRMYKELISGDI